LPIKILSQSVCFRGKTGEPRHKSETFSALFPALAIASVAGHDLLRLGRLSRTLTPSITTSDRDLRRAKFDLVLERQRWSQEEPWNGPYLPLGSSTPKMLKLINSKN
jgi:hypothetical protein